MRLLISCLGTLNEGVFPGTGTRNGFTPPSIGTNNRVDKKIISPTTGFVSDPMIGELSGQDCG